LRRSGRIGRTSFRRLRSGVSLLQRRLCALCWLRGRHPTGSKFTLWRNQPNGIDCGSGSGVGICRLRILGRGQRIISGRVPDNLVGFRCGLDGSVNTVDKFSLQFSHQGRIPLVPSSFDVFEFQHSTVRQVVRKSNSKQGFDRTRWTTCNFGRPPRIVIHIRSIVLQFAQFQIGLGRRSIVGLSSTASSIIVGLFKDPGHVSRTRELVITKGNESISGLIDRVGGARADRVGVLDRGHAIGKELSAVGGNSSHSNHGRSNGSNRRGRGDCRSSRSGSCHSRRSGKGPRRGGGGSGGVASGRRSHALNCLGPERFKGTNKSKNCECTMVSGSLFSGNWIVDGLTELPSFHHPLVERPRQRRIATARHSP
jgi:hypothetical protein